MEVRLSEVIDNEAKRRFEISVDGHTAYLQYAKSAGAIELIHTEVPPELGGRGLGGILAKAALDYAQQAQLRVKPTCSFVRKYLDRHPQYAALL